MYFLPVSPKHTKKHESHAILSGHYIVFSLQCVFKYLFYYFSPRLFSLSFLLVCIYVCVCVSFHSNAKSVFSQKGVEELFRDSDSETGECGRERKVLLPEKNGSHDEYVYKKRMKRKTSDNVVGRGVVLRGDRGGGGSGGDSLPPLHG